MASLFKRLFSKEQSSGQTERVEVMSGSPAYFTPFSGDAYQNDVYRSAVDAIARNAAKLKGTHAVVMGGRRKGGDSKLNRLLQTRPNPHMTAYDLLYKLITHYYLYNNAFAFLDKDDRGNLKAIYPIKPHSMEFMADKSGELYCKFQLGEGRTLTLAYSEVFHVRRHYNDNDLLGDTNSAIIPTLNLAHTQSEGIENSIKSGATIRGLLKFEQVLAPERLKQEKEAFVKDYLDITNSGGIAALDPKASYIPLDNRQVTVEEAQLQAVKSKIYEYLGISESLVNSSYSEDEFAAFYESVIEPLSLQFSLELTGKIFTDREQSFGNVIIFETNRLQFSNNQTRMQILKELMPMGIISVNEAREILNLPTLDDGDRYLQTLNVANTDLVDDYQMEGNDSEGN